MSTDGWTDKANHKYMIDTSQSQKEENIAICNTIDGSWGHCAKWNKSEKNTNDILSHLNVKSIEPNS